MFTPVEQIKRGAYRDCVAALVIECRRQRDMVGLWSGPQNEGPLDTVRDLARGNPRKSEVRAYGYVWGMRPV